MRQNIAEIQPLITNIHCVIRNTMNHGILPWKTVGRYSDCFVYVISGRTVYTFDNYTVVAQAGGVLYLPKGSMYQMNIESPQYEVLYIDFDFAYDTYGELKCEFIDKINKQQTLNYFETMYRIWLSKRTVYKAQCMSVLYKLTAELIMAGSAGYICGRSYDVIRKSVDYIQANYQHSDISIEEAAKLSGISEGHFRRLFKSLYQISPIKYVSLLRIERAKELLIHEDLFTITSIAEMCGYSDIFYFCKAFKREMGITPNEYRAQFHNRR